MSPRHLLVITAVALVAASCSRAPADSADTIPPASTSLAPTGTTTDPPRRPAFCEQQVEATRVGTIRSPELDETSGAALSRSRPGILWLHNDSGNEPAVFAVTLEGEESDRVDLPDLEARDWEDMAIGPGPDPAIDYLYLADIGDNGERRTSVSIHRIPEPAAGTASSPGGETLTFTYPDGPTEAETLLVDPTNGDMVIATKALSGVTRLYAIPGDADWSAPRVADYLGEIRLGSFAVATGGDARADRIVIRTYDEVFLWMRSAGRSIGDTLLGPGCRVAVVAEEQGEAIALGDGGVFYTVSEGVNPPVLRFD